MRRSLDEIIKNIDKVHIGGIIMMNDDLIGYKDKLTLKCNHCGNIFYATYDNVVNKGSGCPYCAGHIKTNEMFINELRSLFGDKLLYNKVQYVNAKTPVTLICPRHGEFHKVPNKALSGQGCPKCKISRLENIVMNALRKNDIDFAAQKKFNWLGKQTLDFYLPKYNIAIECQGEQHYRQVYFNGKKNDIKKKNLFETILKRDINKYNLCNEHDVKIFYFIDNNIVSDEIEKIEIYRGNYYYNIEDLISQLNAKQ